MKRRLVILLAIAGLAAAVQAGELKRIAPSAAPVAADVRLTREIAARKGRPLLINFWATWCEPCREEMPSLQRLAARWQEKGLVVLTVAVADNARRADEFLWEVLPEKATLPVLHDREQVISRAWAARMLPTTVILDRRHRIVGRGQGAIDWDQAAIDAQLAALLK